MQTPELANDLNELLVGEISACETYKQALEKVQASDVREILTKNYECHTVRVEELKKKVVEAGGQPAESSGAWGSFAKMMEGGATMFGDKAAVSVLEEGEVAGLADYKKILERQTVPSSVIANFKVKQESSYDKCRVLHLSMK